MRWRFLLCLGMCSTSAYADGEPPKPPPAVATPAPASAPEQAANAALAAHRANDGAALKSLASKDDPDPWFVADELWARGEAEAAQAFAGAAPRPDTARLPAYLAARKRQRDDAARRASFHGAVAALQGNQAARALSALDALSPGDDELLAVRLLLARGIALDALERNGQAAGPWREAAERAERLGWLAAAARAYRAAGVDSVAEGPILLAMTSRLLRVQELRGDPVGLADAHHLVGVALGRAKRLSEALAEFEKSRALAEQQGESELAAADLGNIGITHEQLGNLEKAEAADRAALELFERRGALAEATGVRTSLSRIAEVKKDMVAARRILEEGVEQAKAHGDAEAEAQANEALAGVEARAGDMDASRRDVERAVALRDAEKDPVGAARTWERWGAAVGEAKHPEPQLDGYRKALALYEQAGRASQVAKTLLRMSLALVALGRHLEAVEVVERARGISQEAGDDRQRAEAEEQLGHVRAEMGDGVGALEAFERALALWRSVGDRFREAGALRLVAYGHSDLGDDFQKALDPLRMQLEILDELEAGDDALQAVLDIALMQLMRGDYAECLRTYQEALERGRAVGDKDAIASAYWGTGHAYLMIGDLEHAQEFAQKASLTGLAAGARTTLASAVQDLATVQVLRGHPEAAVRMLEMGLRMAEASGDQDAIAFTCSFLALAYLHTREFEKALAAQERCNAIVRASGFEQLPIQIALYGAIHEQLGRFDDALRIYDQARKAADRRGDVWTAIGAQAGRTATFLQRGDPVGALAAAHEAVARMPELAKGLDAEAGAFARSLFGDVPTMGVWAARRLDAPAEAAFFLESGRAGTLLEALGGRKALEEVVVPEALRREEAKARSRVAVAQAEYLRAMKKGLMAEIRARAADGDAARGDLRGVVARIQREAKSAAHLVNPNAIPLAETQKLLASDEAMVFYVLGGEQAYALFGLEGDGGIALVATRGAARLVLLARRQEIEEACEGARIEDAAADPAPALARLEALVVAPLGLGDEVRRVLVSADGPLHYVPFRLLFGEREVAYLPSGTTYAALRAESYETGREVLALGRPDYSAAPLPAPDVSSVQRHGLLLDLPRSEEEARAVGDVVLLKGDATGAGFKSAVARRARWRAVHFACHGLVDAEHPTLSALALTPTADDDGLLTVLDVFRAKVPADLVVLSACETGKGRIFKGEGIVGLTQAFMFAGAPRVICSLWKVDDDATRALMIRFYELWNPKDGSKGMGAAAALKAAQEHVKSQEKWKHPYYWAAWVLWGLPQ